MFNLENALSKENIFRNTGLKFVYVVNKKGKAIYFEENNPSEEELVFEKLYNFYNGINNLNGGSNFKQ
tara:strand:- start:640 stop:843 length:204 start_codon:yes stop_codon:yes gene_type:complete